MRTRQHVELEERTGIDLAPMLDFVLNLLIFFIIVTTFVRVTGTHVIRPEAVTAEHKETGNILIAIRPNGEIWMDRQKIPLSGVRAMVERMHIERSDDTVVILADQDSQTGVLTQVMDQVRLAGINEVSIAAQPAGGEGG